jgi:hypothetical protein
MKLLKKFYEKLIIKNNRIIEKITTKYIFFFLLLLLNINQELINEFSNKIKTKRNKNNKK